MITHTHTWVYIAGESVLSNHFRVSKWEGVKNDLTQKLFEERRGVSHHPTLEKPLLATNPV